MGTVYLAFTPGGRPVALKMIRPELADNADFRHRFRQEADAARRVHGLYTAQVLDADPDGSPPWLVTAFVPGLSLEEGVSRNGPLPVDTVLVLMAGVAEALQVIHEAGVVHRDLKPSNVVLAPDGPRVIDFGIARALDASALTGAGTRIGSPQYMAPEQVEESPVGPAADIFALGSVAAYAALGRPPFGEGGALPVMYRVLHEAADLAGCPAPLRGIIERCLVKTAAARPSPAEIITWCRAVTAGRTGQIAQPWLPPGVVAALAAEPLPAPARPRAASLRQDIAAPRPDLAANTRGKPTAILARQQRRIAPFAAVPARPTAPATAPVTAPGAAPAGPRRPSRRGRRLAWTAAVILGLLALPAVALIWLADRGSPAGHPVTGRAPSASAAASWLAGTWTGSASQPTGIVTHWTAELTFLRSGQAGTFRFPSLGCSGTLIVTRTTPDSASVYEDLTRNPRKLCASGGLMTLSRSGATGMRMTWQDATDRSNTATGYLTSG
jgi:protein kinase-like protein